MKSQLLLRVNEEYRKLMPELSGEQRASLRTSLQDEGQWVPIIADAETGDILDGINRYEILKDAGVEPRVETKLFEGTEGEKKLARTAFVLGVNLKRRHLKPAQMVFVARPLLEMERKLAEARMKAGKKIGSTPGSISPGVKGAATDVVAKQLGIAKKQVVMTEAVLDRGTEKQKSDMLSGKREIYKVYEEVKRNENLARMKKEAKEAEKILPDAIQIIHGDFRKVKLEAESIDAIVTDPPYPKEYVTVQRLYEGLVRFGERVLKPGGQMFVMTGQAWLPEILDQMKSDGLRYNWCLAYIVPDRHSHQFNRKVYVNWKPILWFVKKKPGVNDQRPDVKMQADVVVAEEPPDKRFDEWQQSESMGQLVQRYTKPGQVVCDPFLGWGTVAMTCAKLGRKCIGIEIDEKTATAAKGRLVEFFKNRETGKASA